MLRAGRLEDRLVELEVSQRATPVVEIFSAAGMEEMDFNFKDMLGNLFPGKTKQRKVKLGGGPGIPAPGGGRPPHRHGPGGGGGPAQGGAKRHHLFG